MVVSSPGTHRITSCPTPQDLDLHNGWLPENMTEHDCIDAI